MTINILGKSICSLLPLQLLQRLCIAGLKLVMLHTTCIVGSLTLSFVNGGGSPRAENSTAVPCAWFTPKSPLMIQHSCILLIGKHSILQVNINKGEHCSEQVHSGGCGARASTSFSECSWSSLSCQYQQEQLCFKHFTKLLN